MKATTRKDPYWLHRLALNPLLPHAKKDKLAKLYSDVNEIGEQVFSDFLHQQGLAPMWDEMLRRSGIALQFSEGFIASLHQARLHATGLYLSQNNRLSSIKNMLDDDGIPHVIYKGAHSRERYYDEPALRPAVDIDILVAEKDKFAAINAFNQHGYGLFANPDIISHEASLNKGLVTIDLHWDIMRPGRTRVPITDELLKTRQDYGQHWGMSDEAALFIMLVHPVFTKYGTTPQASLMRMVDIALVLTKTNIDWDKAVQLLEQTGLKTAAWTTLSWFALLTGERQTQHIIERLQPGYVRRKYFKYWLGKNLSTLLLEHATLVQLGFTLPAHDRLGDAIHAITRARSLKRSQSFDLKILREHTKS